MGVFEDMSVAVVEGRKDRVSSLTQAALEQGMSAKAILDQGLVAGMDIVAARFRSGEMYVPEVLFSARAMQAGLSLLKPSLVAQGVKARGTVVLGTVHGDLHDIGKSIVGLMLEGAGFTVVDLGTNVATAAFVKAVADNKAEILGMSALLTTTMLEMRHVIAGLQEAGLRGRVKVMVGGAPLTQGFAQEIGADGYGSNAAVAVDLAKRLVAPTTTS